MGASNFSGPVISQEGFQDATGSRSSLFRRVNINVVDGAAAGTFTLPAGAKVLGAICETPVAIPGTPTATNLRLGSVANGAQFVADVNVAAQGFVTLTVLYAGRNPTGTIHFTVASTGGTASAQDGSLILLVEYTVV